MLSVIYALVNSVTYLRVAVRTFTKALTLGEFTVVASYVSKVQGSLSGLIENVLNVTERNMYLGNLFTFFSLVESEDDSDKISLAGKKVHRIEFRNVSFSYPTNPDKKVLKNVSFVIRPYESVLLMGENGAGKTTIIKLINGFYDNYDGDILIDGINIRELKPSSIWREISCMFQDCNLLPITLRENVFFGDVGLQAKYKAGDYEWFDSIVNKYPNHLDTVLLTYLYPNGVEPSGGEKQRIKLYRSIIKDSGVIILDEPTSAIDTETEEQVVRGMRDISKTRTCIIVSHNLSCAVTTDKIIHLKDGVICEEGSHKELMEADGEYKRLFEIKKKLYDEEV